MTSLKDIRLWLIIALALLCLIAVRNCTINYQNADSDMPDSAATASESDSAVVDKAKNQGESEDAAGSGTEDSESEAEVNKLASTEESTKQNAIATTEQNASATDEEQSPVAAIATTGSEAEDLNTGANLADQQSESAATAETNESSETEASDSTGSSEDAAGTVEESDEANSSSATDASSTNSEQTAQVQVIKREITEFTLGDLSQTGEFGVDLMKDIAVARDGLSDYDGRIESLRQFIDELQSGSK